MNNISEVKMRISRQSVGRRKRLLDNISTAISSTRRKRTQARGNNKDWILLVIAASIFILSLLVWSNNNHSDRHLRSGTPPTRTQPTHLPASIVATINKFDRNDFQTKYLVPPPDTTVILFYNLFIPNESEAVQHVIEVVNEQLGQVAKSLQKLEKDKRGAILYYNLIGNDHAFPEEKMKALCSKLSSQLSCKQIGFYKTASESVTLQDMHDYCQRDEVANVRVTYLHAKGSYHQTLVNTNWRRALTDAVVHHDCLFPPDDQCNVCGAQFYTRFALMFPGNMFTAKCSYVKKLIPPLEGGEYGRLKEQSIIKFLKYRLWGQLNTTLLDDRVDYFGLGRYQLEHWIGSHPDIRPCDLHRIGTNLETMITGSIKPDDYKWGMGPRRADVVDEIPKAKLMLMKNKDAQFREYFFLPGNLLKWFTLYGSEGIPSDDSWQWKYFSGGERWKKLVDEYKENAVEEMVMQSSHGFHSAFASNNETNEEAFQISIEDEKRFSESSPSPLVVFYHISIPEGKSKLLTLQAMKSQIEVLSMGQYDIISRAYRRVRPVILYYTMAGDTSNVHSNMHSAYLEKMCSFKPNLTCRKLGQFNSTNVNGETLHHLHNFCLAKPSHSVTYISNQLPQMHGVNTTERFSQQKIRAYTTAVTSKMCLKSRDKCNVCGSEFYPLPFNHFTGNMFTATCDYVKDLLPPKKFEAAMNDVAGDILVSHLRGAVTTELFQFTPQTLGLDQYSVEHWIGSHPNFEPCDVAPVRHSWFPLFSGGSYVPVDHLSSRAYDFQWAEAPRRSSAPEDRRLKPSRERRAIEKNATVFREYHYLAGNLFRWYRLYNMAPSSNSWVWKWYPRGDEWIQGVKKYGSSVVMNLSRQYWDEGVPF